MVTGRLNIRAAGALAAAMAMAGCAGGGGTAPGATNANAPTDSGASGGPQSKLSDFIDFGFGSPSARDGGELAVNRYLWRASLDTLSFLPLASTDPFTGVIATDWAASPDAPGERMKVTAYVEAPELSANALRVAVFREVRGEGGAWTSAPVSPTTTRRLEDAILVRARQLKIAARDTG